MRRLLDVDVKTLTKHCDPRLCVSAATQRSRSLAPDTGNPGMRASAGSTSLYSPGRQLIVSATVIVITTVIVVSATVIVITAPIVISAASATIDRWVVDDRRGVIG
jgi:hypothetical protein